ncbi:MAG TPA: hypothetical protein VK654_04830 [Nitrospirota bacterium]|nr:hypothetical protein [Nitrospirota bacterium]
MPSKEAGARITIRGRHDVTWMDLINRRLRRSRRTQQTTKKALPPNRFDIPLGRGAFREVKPASTALLSRPFKASCLSFASRCSPQLRGFSSSVRQFTCTASRETFRSTCGFLPASASLPTRRLIPFRTGYHPYTFWCWFGNALPSQFAVKERFIYEAFF